MTELCGLSGDDLHHHHGGGDVVVGSGEGVAVLLRPSVGPAHNPHYDHESSSPLFPKIQKQLLILNSYMQDESGWPAQKVALSCAVGYKNGQHLITGKIDGTWGLVQ